MKTKFLFTLTVICLSLWVFSCHKDDEDKTTTDTSERSVVVHSTDFESWHYFSFKTGAEVPQSEVGDYEASKQKTNWDIAFHRGDIRTNSGASGMGQGGAIKLNVKTIAEVVAIPETGFATDESAKIMISMSADGYVEQSKNMVLADWYASEGMPPTYVVNQHVYAIKTADGTVAAVIFTDYTNEEGQGGHVSFSYRYPIQ
ncbi:MAG: HmuY family protein [Bacteroidales bacterium]|nr:HmuY family protein [Bacteroidales bacterium]